MNIDLGCGYHHTDGFLNIDNRFICKPDLVCDLLDGLPFKNDSISIVRAHHILEHIPIGKTIALVEEIYRVLIPWGVFNPVVPSTDGRGAFSDPFHVSFWNSLSFKYYMDDAYRELYGINAKFTGKVDNIVQDAPNKLILCSCVLRAVK